MSKITNTITADEWERLNAIPQEELRMPQEGVEYYEGRTEGWTSFGKNTWWEIYLVWDGGFNGIMQASCKRHWRQKDERGHLSEVIRTDYVDVDRQKLLSVANPPKAGTS